ncbi:hypothetical protein [Thiorhodovibrio litoralis]|nr:hypothetical protein [Thiorhodovibrio litoralis]MBK5969653.1 hypothetical protein [Thiorhodovibrio winogradskyi]WPL15016.1 hypothetical protein Thiosp_04878 [Thiorhodovibrio litoralis]
MDPDIDAGYMAATFPSTKSAIFLLHRGADHIWYLCPVTIAGDQEWLLVNVECGYCQLVIAPEKTPIYIADVALNAIEVHLPSDRDEDNVSASLSGDDVSWHTAEVMPKHVALRYAEARKRIGRCKDVHDAEDVLEQLNAKPLTINGRTFAPTEALEGLLLELADRFRQYNQTTPWWKQWWHAKAGCQPWLEQTESH